jgi:hypothetical protein
MEEEELYKPEAKLNVTEHKLDSSVCTLILSLKPAATAACIRALVTEA